MRDQQITLFKEKLDQHYSWPALYTFKFIVPKEKASEVIDLFSKHDYSEKHSSNGNYISFTVKIMAESSERVVEYYIEAHKIEGIIAL